MSLAKVKLSYQRILVPDSKATTSIVSGLNERATSMDIKSFQQAIQQRAFPLDWPGHWIAGAWLSQPKSKLARASINPNNGKKLIEVQADKPIIGKALDACQAVASQLQSANLATRLGWVQRFRTGLADYQAIAVDALCIEAGKPRWDAEAEVDASLRYLDSIATSGEKILDRLMAPAQLGSTPNNVALLPLGITAAYIPFSNPLSSFVTTFGAAALAGCPLLIMPSSHAVLTAMLAALIDETVELPKGLLNIIFGNFTFFRQAIADRRIAAAIFTGSREHCETIRQEGRSMLDRQLILQSGGKNSVVVHSSADLDMAVKCVVYGAFRSAGQLCTSTSRVFVYRSVAKEFYDRLVAATSHMNIGPTDLPPTSANAVPFMGPLYSDKAVEKHLRFQTMAGREARETLLRGKSLERKGGGYFVTPGIYLMDTIDPISAYQSNVLFSPDLALYEYDTLDTAIEQANATDAPFVLSFIGDPSVVEKRRAMIHAPNVICNAPTIELETSPVLSGRTYSGNFRFNGAGITAQLTYPQVIRQSPDDHKILASWPWPQY